MPRRHSPLVLLPLFVLAACGEDPSPTAPTPPSETSAEAVGELTRLRVVNSLADPGDGVCDARQCTLREAIRASGTTAITFAPGLAGPITLAAPDAHGGPLSISTALTISGPAAGITIRRRNTDPSFRILRVGEGATVTLTNLAFRNGKADILGGGIINYGTLALINCTVAGNASSTGGGGIENRGPLTLTHSTVADNSAPSGGGIDNVDARLVASNSVIARNSGGGIGNRGGTLQLTNTTVSDNVGFGIAEDRSTSTLDRLRITGNSGGGYSLHQGKATLTNSTIARNSAFEGAGILNAGGGDLTIAKSTVTGNTASGRGGGILDLDDPFGRVGASITLINSTVSGNSAESGGGIQISQRGSAGISIVNSTVASNSARDGGGGISQQGGLDDGSSGISLTNSLVALNTAPAGPDLLGSFQARFSLIGDGTGSDLTNTDGNQVGNVSPNTGPIDPLLGPLADNGGPTRTRALLPGSPAIDAASSDGCPGRDQRGVSRPQGPACDIGSYERE
ncbi:MAG: choice-of-anchor Q domain-containing protein [Gemmatimonadales bacterium]